MGHMVALERVRSQAGGPKALGAAAVVLAVLGALVAGMVALASEILEAVGEGDGVALWDRPVLDWASSVRTPDTVGVMSWFTHTGGPVWQPIIMAAIALFLWWRWQDITPLVLVVIAELLALGVAQAAKRAVNRARPPTEDAIFPYETSPSFPSGHTLQAFAAAATVAYLLIRHLWDQAIWLRVLIAGLAVVYACLMGFSRVFLGYHWLTDVLAAALLGIASSAVVIAGHRVWRFVRRKDSPPIEASACLG